MEIWRPSWVVQESTMRCDAKAGVDTSQRNTREFPGVTSTRLLASEDEEVLDEADDNAGLTRTA